MKKTLLFFITIVATLSFSSCNNEDFDIGNETNNRSSKIRWYGVNIPNEISTRGVSDKAKLWNQNAGIAIKFINNPADTSMIERIKTIASEWESYAGIKFNYVENDQKASVRIAFDWNGNDWLTWSYTGTDARYVRNQSEPTANFGGLQYQNEKQFKGDVLRIFGQILGLEYEQRHQDWSFWRSEIQLKRYWESMFYDTNMDWEEIKDYVFTPLNGDNAVYPTQTEVIDELSIMAWPYYTRPQTPKLIANYELSEGDKAFIAILYPKENIALPTIQEAWVDAGYFTWTNANKNQLKITALGANQKTLPDVSDGEQLTNASGMFLYSSGIALTKAPSFNTSNITDFSQMFQNASNLLTVPQYNTSKGTNFSGLFDGCKSLKESPTFDTANGKFFSSMFYGTAIAESPYLDTSKGIIFAYMFGNCQFLQKVSLYDTAKGTNFIGMFSNCKILKELPTFDTAKGVNLQFMFENCSSLRVKPNLDLSKATNTTDMYKGTPFENSL